MSLQTTVGFDVNNLEAFAHRVRGEWAGETAAQEGPWLARAAAPLDCMGGFAEYCGSLTLTLPTSEFVCCAAQTRCDEQVHVSLMLDGQNGHPHSAFLPLAMWYEAGELADAATVRARLESAGHGWARAPVGSLHALLAAGAVPHLGGGVSLALATSMRWEHDGWTLSAATAATMAAACKCMRIEHPARDMARWCQSTENQWADLTCGPSGALCALSGEAGKMLRVRCQPLELEGQLPLPNSVTFVGVDCGARHPGATRKYREARTAAFMGRRVIECLFAARSRTPDWGGHLARLSVSDYVQGIRDRLPTKMKGRDFIARFGPIDDPLCLVEDDAIYKIRSRTEHHIYENNRVHEFAERMVHAERTGEQGPLLEAGELMFASHWSYGQRCGLGSIETDRLVTLLRQRGPASGIFGAKICGCGAGGLVGVLMSDTDAAHQALRDGVAEYSELLNRTTRIARGSSDGALVYGVRQAE